MVYVVHSVAFAILVFWVGLYIQSVLCIVPDVNHGTSCNRTPPTAIQDWQYVL